MLSSNRVLYVAFPSSGRCDKFLKRSFDRGNASLLLVLLMLLYLDSSSSMKPREFRRSFLRSLQRATIQATIPLLGLSWLFHTLRLSTPFVPSSSFDDVPSNISDDTRSISNVIDLSLRHVEPKHSISAAVCYKALFGTIDFGIILQWVAYHRLLGFDAFYFFYRDEVLSLPRFDELQAMPFVTLIPWNDIGTRESYYNQASGTEVECLSNYAQHFDWVFIADVDEFLWLGPDAVTQQYSVKDILYLHRDMTYLSFGKRMYSLSHRVDMEATNYYLDTSQPHFAVSDYPYFMDGYFCHHKGFRRGDPFCPKWRGRSKVIVRPQNHTFIDVHGTYHHPLDPSQGTIHFHPDVYHVKEFPHIFVAHNITRHPLGRPEEMEFTIHSEAEVHIHNIHTGYLPINTDPTTGEETFLVRFDPNLTEWFQYVMNRASDGQGSPIRVANHDYSSSQ